MDMEFDCTIYDLASPVITFRDEMVIRVGDIVADPDFGLAVVRGACHGYFWWAEPLHEGTC